jgi:hypothetical protein
MGQDASLRRVSFDAAWRLTHNVNPADDVWVVGWCR